MSTIVTLEGELTVFTVHATKERLMAALQTSPDIGLDVRGVSEVDGAGVQLLLATRREAQQRGGSLRVGGCPPQLKAAMELTDLCCEFGEPLNFETEATV